MNPQNVLAVILLSLVVLRPVITLGADPTEFIQKICTECSRYRPQDDSLCIKFMSPFAGEIAGDLGRAAIKALELDISSINLIMFYLNKFKPPPGTSSYMLEKIKMLQYYLRRAILSHHGIDYPMKSMVPQPPTILKSSFRGTLLRLVHISIVEGIDFIEKSIDLFDPPESPLKTDLLGRINGVNARAYVAKCLVYSYSQTYK